MTEFKHFRVETGQEGILWLLLDYEQGETNILSSGLLDEFNAVLDHLIRMQPTGLALGSAKKRGFIAGADVKEFTRIRGFEDAHAMLCRGQQVMNRIEALPFPTVAVINGFCLGGGLELALACNFRVATDDPSTRIGFPEVKLGIHPGFGGTVRSIRVLGPLVAMNLMLTGRTVDARKAQKIGLIDHTVPARLLRKSAEEVILHPTRERRPRFWIKALNRQPLRSVVSTQMIKQVAKAAKREHYPAPYELVELWRRCGGNEKVLMDEEAKSVARLSTNPTARNLVRVFMLQDMLKSGADKSLICPAHVHVVGAGVMGGDIAAWCALQGLKVTVQDTNRTGLAKALQRANKYLARRFRGRKHLANAVMDRLIPDERGLGVGTADVIIEAIFEDIDAKQSLYRELEPKARSDALFATNTSSIRLENLSHGMRNPDRLVGLHFFNPVAKMPLVEVVRSPQTSPGVVEQAMAFARHIDKLPIIVSSSPGFLVNRVLMPYLLEAVNMLEEGVPKTVVDRAATDFGMPMGPIRLADTVGLDVCLFVAGILSRDLGLEVPERLRQLVAKGFLGSKSGNGFYRYRNGKIVREKEPAYLGELAPIQARLVKCLTNEAETCLQEKVVENSDLLDAGIIFGTGFAPFRGGPLHYLQGQRSSAQN